MADVVLRDRNGNPLNFPGTEYIDLVTPDETEAHYALYDPETLLPGNIAEGVVVGDITGTKETVNKVETSIDLDFSGGAMEVTPETGSAFSKVNIPVPANLVPENIPEGLDIAGIIGTLAAGGGNVKMATGIISTSDVTSTKTITHGLGVVPDLVWCYSSGFGSNKYQTILIFSVSKKLQDKIGVTVPGCYVYKATGSPYYGAAMSGYYLEDTASVGGVICEANENTFKIKLCYHSSTTTSCMLYANAKWTAISLGLT